MPCYSIIRSRKRRATMASRRRCSPYHSQVCRDLAFCLLNRSSVTPLLTEHVRASIRISLRNRPQRITQDAIQRGRPLGRTTSPCTRRTLGSTASVLCKAQSGCFGCSRNEAPKGELIAVGNEALYKRRRRARATIGAGSTANSHPETGRVLELSGYFYAWFVVELPL